jgi:hypothetical protein
MKGWKMVKVDPPWTPFESCVLPDRSDLLGEPIACWKNSRYTVWVYELPEGPWGDVTHLSIKRNDKEAIHDWRDLQRIKNEVTDPRREAVEIYPAEARLTDTANQYHLWVLALGKIIPIGFHDGRVVSGKPGLQAKQRPFEQEPEDQIEVPDNIEDIRTMTKRDMPGRRAQYEEFLKSLPQQDDSDG